MIISTNHSLSQLQSATSAYNFIKIPSTQGAAINSTYGISAYPTIIAIKPNKQIYDQDIWPIDNTILRNTITGAGGTPQSCATSIEDVKQTTLNVYPNPANNFIYVETGINTETQYEIYNVVGEKLLTENNGVKGRSIISTTTLPDGQYYIRIFNDNKLLGTQKFVIIK